MTPLKKEQKICKNKKKEVTLQKVLEMLRIKQIRLVTLINF